MKFKMLPIFFAVLFSTGNAFSQDALQAVYYEVNLHASGSVSDVAPSSEILKTCIRDELRKLGDVRVQMVKPDRDALRNEPYAFMLLEGWESVTGFMVIETFLYAGPDTDGQLTYVSSLSSIASAGDPNEHICKSSVAGLDTSVISPMLRLPE